MAELLIRAKTNGADPKVYFQRGHVVYVKPDGSKWGASEGPPEFYIVRVKGTVDEWVTKLLSTPQVGVDAETGEPQFEATPDNALDVDAPAPVDRAAVRVPKLLKHLRKQPMARRLDAGEKMILHRKGLPIRRVY